MRMPGGSGAELLARKERPMAEPTIDEVLRDNHDVILAAVQVRMRGDETVGRVAKQRDLSERELTGQVLGFTLEATRSDLTLGSTVAMGQGLHWLARLGVGHDLPFDGAMLRRLFDTISAEIDARLDSEALRQEYAAYRAMVGKLIADAFPE
jgi:hypothetical protein